MSVIINHIRGYGYRTPILDCLIVLLGERDSMAMETGRRGGDRPPPAGGLSMSAPLMVT